MQAVIAKKSIIEVKTTMAMEAHPKTTKPPTEATLQSHILVTGPHTWGTTMLKIYKKKRRTQEILCFEAFAIRALHAKLLHMLGGSLGGMLRGRPKQAWHEVWQHLREPA